MPRRGFGPRPVEILAPTSRTTYTALVQHLMTSLPASSRRDGQWREHLDFGRTGEHSYVVEIDFASCYELIDHDDLKAELLLRSFDSDAVTALAGVLSGLGRHGRGLPQMLESSDRLADTYLSIIDRRLQRRGHILHRFADDMRILASSWYEANDIIEETAIYARELGMILASSKTRVRRREVVDHTEKSIKEFFTQYVDATTADLTDFIVVDQDYDSAEVYVRTPEESVALTGAYSRILDSWHENWKLSQSDNSSLELPIGLANSINAALSHLSSESPPVPLDLLLDLVFHDPVRLENVSRYLVDGLKSKVRNKTYVKAALTQLFEIGSPKSCLSSGCCMRQCSRIIWARS